MTESYQQIFEVTRGRIVESIHFGAAAVVDSGGRLLAWLGDPKIITFLRSSAKPFQALPFIEGGGDQTFHLTSKEVAIICGSHDGTDEHVEVIKGIQAKAGVQESDLLCGAHPLSHVPTVEAMRARGETPTPNRHNCSGKHTGMLAAARIWYSRFDQCSGPLTKCSWASRNTATDATAWRSNSRTMSRP